KAAHWWVWTNSGWGGVSGVGLGNGRQRAGARLPEEVRIGDGAQWTHPPDEAERRRTRDLPYRGVHRIPSATAGQGRFARPDESAGGTTEGRSGNHGRELRARPTRAGG